LDLSSNGNARNEFRATATERQKFQVHMDFGRIFEGQGDFEAAVLEYQDALTILHNKRRGDLTQVDEALVHRRVGGALGRLGRFALAEVHYKKAMQLAPKDPRVWNDAGYSYYLQGRYAEAEITLKTGLSLAPDDERIKTNLGLSLAALGRNQEALGLLSQSSGDAIAHANLGYLLAATGQLDLARQQYETALALRPELDLARRALAQLDHRQHPAPAVSHMPTEMAQSQSQRQPFAPVDSSVQRVSPSGATRAVIPPPRPGLRIEPSVAYAQSPRTIRGGVAPRRDPRACLPGGSAASLATPDGASSAQNVEIPFRPELP
jgi:tetratricopeptide (TPR) repeat protein